MTLAPKPRIGLALVASLFIGSLIGYFISQASAPLRTPFAAKAPECPAPAAAVSAPNRALRLTEQQIEAAKITLVPVQGGAVRRSITVPALVTPDPDRVARVAAKVAGTVAEMRKKLGDRVEKGEAVAVIDSREVADAKAEYLAALTNYDLQSALFEREKGLFRKQIVAEQLFLKAKTVYTEAKLRLDLARQKLAALDLSESEIAALPHQAGTSLSRKEIHAPISGRVSERLASIGQPVGGEGQIKELYALTDLSTVEADLSVPVADLPLVHEKQAVSLTTSEGREAPGVVAYVNAVLTPETRAGHVIAAFDNKDHALRPGSLLNARIVLGRNNVGAKVPRGAVQTISDESVVFVRTKTGFEKRRVELGDGDDDFVEVRAGVKPGEAIAVENSFVLKAELGKNDIPQE